MNNSADIRKENKKSIYRIMLDGRQYTKQQLSMQTGLSAATCNTLLNDMQIQGIVRGEDRLVGEVGRRSVLYQIKDEHESYLAIHFYMEQGNKLVESIVFSAVGRILAQKRAVYEQVDYKQLEQIIGGIAEDNPGLAQIIVGTPSIAENGIIKHCDIPELENVPLKACLEKKFGIAVAMENDMHHKAYGYCKKGDSEDEVVTLGYFSSHILPGTATIHRGTIIRGANGFAGMTGFLPYDMSREEVIAMLKPGTCIPFIAESLCAIIVLLNPGKIVLTGDLINEDMLKAVREKCETYIPKEYMPQLLIEDSFDKYYYEGMFQLAVDRKEI